METEHIRLTREGAIARLTIARAAHRNAINTAMMRDLIAASRELEADEAVRAVLVRSEGEDFSVGADLKEGGAPQGKDAPSRLKQLRLIRLGENLMSAIQTIPQPTIALLKGVATGAGACIASACDFRIASPDARVGYGEVKLGINLMWRALPPCVHLVGPARAKRMIMTGQLFGADTLKAWGFVDEVVAAADLEASGLEWAQDYAALPPIAVQMIKRSVNAVAGALDAAIMHADSDQWALAAQTEDYKEAVSAFFDKRPPLFTGN